MYARRILKEMLMPWVVASQAIPVFALAPLLVLWFGYGLGSKVAMSLLITFFPVTLATLSGLTGYEEARSLLRAYRIPEHLIFFRVTLPGALPDILTGWKVSAGVAPIAAVIGEWVGAERGLGYVMLRYNAQLRVDRMFAALILLAVLGLGLTWMVEQIERRWVFWRGLEHSCRILYTLSTAWGSRGYPAERDPECGSDPWNLIRVMPAEGRPSASLLRFLSALPQVGQPCNQRGGLS
jgi:ABC-type nitrate/sulfonate/bicarbonate transport system permease component